MVCEWARCQVQRACQADPLSSVQIRPQRLGRYGVMLWTGCVPFADVTTQSGKPFAGKGLFNTVTNTPVLGFSLNPVTELSRLFAVYR